MFDRVPFGSSGWIVGDGNSQGKRVGQLGLKLRLPGVAAITIAAAGVGQNENLTRAGVPSRTFLLPPVGNGMGGESGRIMRNTHDEGTSILREVVDAIGNGDADGIGAEVVVKDAPRAAFPTAACIPEVADQFAFLGVDTDDGKVTTLESTAKFSEIFELEITVRTGVGGDLLVIDAQRIPHLIEQPRNGVGADTDAELAKFLGDSGGRAA